MLAVDVSNWLRPGAATSRERLFCHVYGRGKGQAQMIPGWPYSVVAALEPGRTSWTAVLDAVRLGPGDDEAEATVAQVREVITRLIEAGHWHDGDLPVLVIVDAGYDPMRLTHQLTGLPAEVLGRLRSGRVLHCPRVGRRSPSAASSTSPLSTNRSARMSGPAGRGSSSGGKAGSARRPGVCPGAPSCAGRDGPARRWWIAMVPSQQHRQSLA
jgi:DDE superfamily endonuclease